MSEMPAQPPAAILRTLPDDMGWFRALSASSPVGIFVTDPAGNCLYANPRLQAICGFTESEALGSGWSAFVDESDRRRVVRGWTAAAAAGNEYDGRVRFRWKDGAIRWTHIRTAPMRDASGVTLGHVGTAEDITDEVAAGEELRRFKFISDNASDAYFLIDANARLTYVNRTACEWLGYSEAELLRMGVPDIDANYPTERVQELIQRVGTERVEPFDSVISRRDGTTFAVEISVTGVRIDDEPYLFAAVRDISFRKQIEAQLVEAERHYQVLFESAKDAAFVTNEAGCFIDVNPAACELLGYERDAIIGQHFTAFMVDADTGEQRVNAIRQSLTDEGSWQGVAQRRRADGRIITVEVSVSRLTFVDGQHGYFSVHRNITERARLEQLQRDFIRMVSHDLRSPLTGIRITAQLMQRRGRYDDESMTRIIEMTDRMQRQLADLLDVERLEANELALHPETVDLLDVIRSCVEWARSFAGRRAIRLDADETAPVIGHWDRRRIEQVLENLLSNAVKYTPETGAITVRLRARDETVEVEVADNGAGIPPDELPRIFSRFYRVERGDGQTVPGVGLGLYITRMLLDAMGGDISVESSEGAGTEFRFTLPRGDSARTHEPVAR